MTAEVAADSATETVVEKTDPQFPELGAPMTAVGLGAHKPVPFETLQRASVSPNERDRRFTALRLTLLVTGRTGEILEQADASWEERREEVLAQAKVILSGLREDADQWVRKHAEKAFRG